MAFADPLHSAIKIRFLTCIPHNNTFIEQNSGRRRGWKRKTWKVDCLDNVLGIWLFLGCSDGEKARKVIIDG